MAPKKKVLDEDEKKRNADLISNLKVSLLFSMAANQQQTITMSRREVKQFKAVAQGIDFISAPDTEGNWVFRAVSRPAPTEPRKDKDSVLILKLKAALLFNMVPNHQEAITITAKEFRKLKQDAYCIDFDTKDWVFRAISRPKPFPAGKGMRELIESL